MLSLRTLFGAILLAIWATAAGCTPAVGDSREAPPGVTASSDTSYDLPSDAPPAGQTAPHKP